MSLRAIATVTLGLAVHAACVPSNVVAVEDRAVVTPSSQLEWRASTETDIPGLYASASLEGPLAFSLLKIYYLFEADGAMAAAALVEGDSGPQFQVIDGRWEYDGGALILDGAEPATVDAADGFLRLSGAEGTIVLRREVVQ